MIALLSAVSVRSQSNGSSDKMTDKEIDEMVCQIIGLRPQGAKLLVSDALTKAAQVQADYMLKIDQMTHDNNEAGPFDQRQKDSGLDNWGGGAENVATSDSVNQVMGQWKNSPKHMQNMQNTDYNVVGVAKNGKYWAQEFAKDTSSPPKGREVQCNGQKNNRGFTKNGGSSDSQEQESTGPESQGDNNSPHVPECNAPQNDDEEGTNNYSVTWH
ncbi:hypothetical protein H4219_002381 [Mycoemilia scoparia]|uniref:SCP domain-containing protein n=1 Tax=Mycoemilia scoparia TaxID=417184 RepID=A0A9W8A5M7_9FUNG|nr:hypothetical protein H4219_002381 [Mycoemilia scoparia]